MTHEEASKVHHSLKDESVLSLSIEPWDSVWRSRHQVMSRLGQDNKVLFASLPPDIGQARKLMSKGGRSADTSVPITGQLREYLPSPWLPINYRSPLVDSWIEQLRRRRLRGEMRRLGMKRPVLYIWHPCFVDSIGAYDESLVVFHCYDEYSAFTASDAERNRLRQQEERLVRRADLVIAASASLADARRSLNSCTRVVENGVDYDRFSRAQDADLHVPKELASLPGPVIGCVFTHLGTVDVAMLDHVLTQRPTWQMAVIGMERPRDVPLGSILAKLLSRPNLHFLGRQPNDAVPAYLKGCSVCIIPYVVNDITSAASSPLKLYEYLAAGKPVVSARLPLMSHLSHVVGFADKPGEWVDAIEQALASEGTEATLRRQQIAMRNTWDQRVSLIRTAIADTLKSKFA